MDDEAPEPVVIEVYTMQDVLMLLAEGTEHGLTAQEMFEAAKHAAGMDDLLDAISLLGIGAIDVDPLRTVLKGRTP
jgi:hypothetical protein